MFPLLQRPEFSATDQNDLGRGSSSDDRFDGLGGVDTVTFSSTFAQASVLNIGGDLTVTTRTGGTDRLENVERLEFSDRIMAYDFNGNAGQTYRLYQAAFGRTPDLDGLSHNVGLTDAGLSQSDMANAFIGSAEFELLYGSSTSDETFVQALYQNVLGRSAEAAGLTGWLDRLASGDWSRAQVLIGFSESLENKTNVQDAISDGIELTPLAERDTNIQAAMYVDRGLKYGITWHVVDPAIYITDGTSAGSRVIAQYGDPDGTTIIEGEPDIGVPSIKTVFDGGKVLYSAAHDTAGYELWTMNADGSDQTLLRDIYAGPTGQSDLTGLRFADDTYIFIAADSEHGRSLWTTDGSFEGTHLVSDLYPDQSGPLPGNYTTTFQTVGDRLAVFTFDAGQDEFETWITDGTETGTHPLLDIVSGSTGHLRHVQPIGNGAFTFWGATDHNTWDLWISNGTAEGTSDLGKIASGDGDIAPESDAAGLLDNGLLVFDFNVGTAHSLFVTDGTKSGTKSILDFNGMDNYYSAVRFLDSYADGSLGFLTYTPDNEIILWKTDGTAEGTVLLKELKSSSDTAAYESTYAVSLPDGNLLFNADDGTDGLELWTSDGTAEGTIQTADLYNEIPDFPNSALNSRFTDMHKMANGSVLLGLVVTPEHSGALGELWHYDPLSHLQTKLAQVTGSRPEYAPSTSVKIHDFSDHQALVTETHTVLTRIPSQVDGVPWITDGTVAGTEIIGTDGVTDSSFTLL